MSFTRVGAFFEALESRALLSAPVNVPGTIEAENFDDGGEGVAYHDNTAGNTGGQYRSTEDVDIQISGEGGYDVGWIGDGEWLAYTVNVAAAGSYSIQLRVASRYSIGTLHANFNGADTAKVAVPKKSCVTERQRSQIGLMVVCFSRAMKGSGSRPKTPPRARRNAVVAWRPIGACR